MSALNAWPPERRRPGGKTWPTQECRFPSDNRYYLDAAQTSSDISRLAHVALSEDELSEWQGRHVVCRGDEMSQEGLQ